MSHFADNIFTDDIHDAIGNQPVLDQFDISYEASFYGSMQDDYITGSILAISNNSFITGSRARKFSKQFAELEVPLSSEYDSITSAEVVRNPLLSYRQVPWQERVSHTAYRIVQCHDGNERYYDSCIPDLSFCLKQNGSVPFSISGSRFEVNSAFFLSPYNNVVTASVGYMIFNGSKVDRTNIGLTDDPLVNNKWTWSFPYETQYDPNNRLTKTNDVFGINFCRNETTINSHFTDINFLTKNRQKLIKSIIPILPGHLNKSDIATHGRNSLRVPSTVFDGTEDIYFPALLTGTISNSLLDNSLGMSYLIPSEVFLNKQNDHGYLNSYTAISAPFSNSPASVYQTGSMVYTDLIKFFFGYGDLNNITYESQFDVNDPATSYFEGFEVPTSVVGTNSGKLASAFSSLATDDLIIDWSFSPNGATPGSGTPMPWTAIYRGSTFEAPTVGITFAAISSSFTSSILTQGIYWQSSSIISDPPSDFVLLSATTSSFHGAIPTYTNALDEAAASFVWSTACVEITASYPFIFNYSRAIAGHPSDYLAVYFSGVPNSPSHRNPSLSPGNSKSGFYPLVDRKNEMFYIEKLFGMASGSALSADSLDGGAAPALMQMSDKFSFVDDKWSGPIMPSGEYRLCFSYVKILTLATPARSKPDIAAIDNFVVKTLKPNLNLDRRIGANNYPMFRAKKVDTRFNPIASTDVKNYNYLQTFISGTQNNYAGYTFGISPVIRGWKYGLYSGLPAHSKATFRRNRFGQLRDMLEQRQYTKFINDGTTTFDNEAILRSPEIKELGGARSQSATVVKGSPGPSPVEVNFVRQAYRKTDRGIGEIYVVGVQPNTTYSQNLSTEATSSLPYFDGFSRNIP